MHSLRAKWRRGVLFRLGLSGGNDLVLNSESPISSIRLADMYDISSRPSSYFRKRHQGVLGKDSRWCLVLSC